VRAFCGQLRAIGWSIVIVNSARLNSKPNTAVNSVSFKSALNKARKLTCLHQCVCSFAVCCISDLVTGGQVVSCSRAWHKGADTGLAVVGSLFVWVLGICLVYSGRRSSATCLEVLCSASCLLVFVKSDDRCSQRYQSSLKGLCVRSLPSFAWRACMRSWSGLNA